jgi:hypothetical protein
MNVETTVRKLVQEDLEDNHEVEAVRFIDRLLLIASEVEEIQCGLTANQCGLWFQVPGQPAWEVEIGRAKSKLRMLCARLAVLCMESGGQDFILYGGDGIIDQACAEASPSASTATSVRFNGPPGVVGTTQERPRDRPGRWAVRTMNTMSEQHFTIRAL